MNWKHLTSINQLEEIIKESHVSPVLIFKHSTRCSTSRMSLDRLERNWKDSTTLSAYFLDLLNHRDISDSIANTFRVEHESPQVLLIYKGESILDQSHFEIDYNQIVSTAKNETQPVAK